MASRIPELTDKLRAAIGDNPAAHAALEEFLHEVVGLLQESAKLKQMSADLRADLDILKEDTAAAMKVLHDRLQN